ENDPKFRADWLDFALNEINPAFVAVRDVPDARFQAFLVQRYADLQAINQNWAESFESVEQIRLNTPRWRSGPSRSDYQEFLSELPPEHLELVGPEFAWRDWLAARYGDLALLNTAHEASWSGFDAVPLPIAHLEAVHVREHAGSLRWTYAVRNFIN